MNANSFNINADFIIDEVESNDVYTCKYYSENSFKIQTQNVQSVNGLSIINFNIRSFTKNSVDFLVYLKTLNHEFDIMIITETWGREEFHSLCHIPGYNSIHNFRREKKGGGVSLYIKEHLNYSEIEALNLSNGTIESVAASIGIRNNNRDETLKILGIYRPPKGRTSDFIELLNGIIENHRLSEGTSIIAGDINVCLLKEDSSNHTKDFMNLMRATNFYPLITRPTRICEETITRREKLSLIDHIWINSPILPSCGILLADITDHYPVYCLLKLTPTTSNSLSKITFRKRKPENYNLFKQKLENLNLLELIRQSPNINDMTNIFLRKLDELHNTCFPILTKQINTKHLSKPWITTAIQNSIRQKHELFKEVKLNRYNKENYKTYCNNLTTIMRNARKNYFTELFDRNKQDIKRTWSIINSTIKPGRKRA